MRLREPDQRVHLQAGGEGAVEGLGDVAGVGGHAPGDGGDERDLRGVGRGEGGRPPGGAASLRVAHDRPPRGRGDAGPRQRLRMIIFQTPAGADQAGARVVQGGAVGSADHHKVNGVAAVPVLP